MRGRKGVLQNLGILTVAQVAAQLLNLAALVYLARSLGEHWFGVVQVGVAVAAYALVTAEWGLFSLGIRETARLDSPPQVRDYARTHLGLMIAGALAVLGLGVLILPRLSFFHADPIVFWLYLALVIPQIFMQEWVGLGLERMTHVGVARTLTSLLYAALILGLLGTLDGVGGQPAWRWVPAIFILAYTVGNLSLAVPVGRWLGGMIWPRLPEWAEWRRRWRETGPIGASNLTMRVVMNGDMILLGLLSRPEIAGQYAASAKIGFMLVVAMEVLWKALLPRLSRLARESAEAFQLRFQLYFGLVAAGLLPLAVGGLLLGPDLMLLVYGTEYAGAGPVFSVLSLSYALFALDWFLGNSLIATDRQGQFFPPLVAGAVVAMGTGAVLITLVDRVSDGLAAAFGMLTGHVVLLLILTIICRRWFSRRLLPVALTVTVALAALVVAVQVAGQEHVLVRVGAGGLAYLVVAAWPLKRWTRGLLA